MPDGSSITSYEPLHVIVHPRPFMTAHHWVDYGTPPTIAEIVLDAEIPEDYASLVRVWIDDDEIPRHLWPRVRPKLGHLVRVLVLPGKDKKNPLATILMLVVAVVAAIAAPMLAPGIATALGFSATGSAAAMIASGIAATINLVGALVISALIPPPEQPQTSIAGPAVGGDVVVAQPSFQITGSANRYNNWGPIPRVMGRRRIFPVMAGRPYTETQGADQYVRMLLLCGYGPLQISDIRIGETPLGFFTGVQIEVREGWTSDTAITLYTRTIREDALSIRLIELGDYAIRTSHEVAVEISLDIAFPRGLVKYLPENKQEEVAVDIQVACRPVGSGTWQYPTFIDPAGSGFEATGTGALKVKRAQREAFRVGVRFPVASGTWEVAVKNLSAVRPSDVSSECYWTAMRTVQSDNPIRQSGLSLIALRIKASHQLNGVPDQVNCIAMSYLPQWNGSAYVWGLTRNPAWAYLDVLRRRGTEYLLDNSRIDLDGISAWAGACASAAPGTSEEYHYFDAVIEGGSVFNSLRTIAATGRASFGMKDGKYSIVRDIPQTVPVQHITPRNSWGYNGNKRFLDLPHALKIRFVNEDLQWQEDERLVYDDGFNETNASKFETIDMPAVTRSSQAWREGRYFIAQGKLRPEEHRVSMDIESLRATMGDLVQFAHFAISIGLAQGRVTGHVLDTLTNSYVEGIELDGEVTFDVAHAYAIRCRLSNGTSQVHALINPTTTASITTRVVTLYTRMLTASAPQLGDLCMYGRVNLETAPMLIKRIEPGPNLTAEITMVDAQPGVWTADSAAIPPFQSYITHYAPPQYRLPPEIPFSLRSDESALLINRDGGLRERIAVDIGAIAFTDVVIAGFEAQYSRTGHNDWRAMPRVGFDIRTIYVEPVSTGFAYDVRVRAISQGSIAGNWRMVSNHVVIGKSTPPPPPTRVLLQGNLIVVDYPNAPLDFLGFKVEYHRGVSPNRVNMHSAHPSSTTVDMPFDISSLPNGLLTIFVSAMDTTGNLSEARPIYIVVPEAATANQIDVIDYHALGFPGTITNGTIDVLGGTGDLGNQGDPTDFFLPAGADRFLPLPDELFLISTFLEMTWEFTLVPDDIDVPSQMTISYTVEPARWRLEYSGGDSSLFAAVDDQIFAVPDPDEFAPVDLSYGPFPAWITAQHVPYKFRVILPGGHVEGRISKFIISLDVPDEEEEMEDVVVDAAGLRLVLTKSYREIRHISYILQNDGNNAVKIEKHDYNVTLGPLVQPFNTAGAAVQALADFRIKGVAA